MKTLLYIILGLALSACAIKTDMRRLNPEAGKKDGVKCKDTVYTNGSLVLCKTGHPIVVYGAHFYHVSRKHKEHGETSYHILTGEVFTINNNELVLE